MKFIDRFRMRFGDLWWYSILIFIACRSGDLIQAFIGLWLVPKYVPQSELGAALPLLQIGGVFGIPLAILVVPFSRWLTIYATKGEKGKIKRLLSLTFSGVVVTFLIAVIAARFVLPAFFERLSVAKGSLGFLIICAGLMAPFSTVFGNALQGLKRYKAIAFINAIGAPVRLVVMLVAMPFRALSGYILGQMSAPLLVVVFSCHNLRKELGRSVKSTPLGRMDVRAILTYSVPFAVYSVIGTLLGAWQSLLFRQRLPEMESAAFYMISRLSEVATYAAMAMMAVVFPMAVEATQKGESDKPILGKLMFGSLGAGLAVTIGLCAVGRPLLNLVPLWRDYIPYAWLLSVFALRMTLCATNSAFFSYETAAGRFKFLRYWIPLTLLETGTLVALTGHGAFRGILPDGVVDWMASLRAARLSFFIYWLLGVTTLQAIVIGIHLLLRHRCAARKGAAQ